MSSGRRFFLVLTVALAAACSGPASKPGSDARRAQATQRGPARGELLKGPPRRDKPQEARDFYVKKRAPVGANTIPVERYQAAREEMGRMPLYSTRTGALAPRRAGGVGAAANVALGTWNPLGPGNIGGRTRAIAINPSNPDIMYAGGVAGGVWKTTNGGASWSAVGDDMANLAVSTIALRPGTPGTILAGTGEGYFNGDSVRGAGIFRSTDSGATWTQISQPLGGNGSDFHYINKIVFYDADTVFAATGSGVYRSSNGGQTWSDILIPSTGSGEILLGGCLDIAVRTDQPTVFASCGTFGLDTSNREAAARVYRTLNATAPLSQVNWTSYNPSLDGADLGSATYLTEPEMGRTSLAIAPSNQDVIYAVAAHNQFDHLLAVYYSGDGGNSWQKRAPEGSLGFESALLLTNPPYAWPCGPPNFPSTPQYYNQGWYDNAVAVDPLDSNVVWVGGIDLFRSDNGGFDFGLASFWWKDSSPAYAHADQHTIVFHPNYNGGSNKQVFFGNDGGIFKSVTPDGDLKTGDDICFPPTAATPYVTFTSLNNGYGVTQFYYGTVFPDDKQYMGGTQDNGTIYGSDSAGANGWTELLGGDGGAVAVDPNNTDILYAEYTGLSIHQCQLGPVGTPRCNPDFAGGGNLQWRQATDGINDTGFLFIAPFILDPTNNNFLYTGGRYLWRTENKAASWFRASASTGSSVSATAIAPSNGSFALMGTEDGYIHRNANVRTASSSTVWAKVRPREGYVSSVAFDPYDPNVAYATYSTFGGVHVYKSVNAGAAWTDVDGSGVTGIPDVPVHSVVVDPTTDDPGTPRRIYVGTDIGVFVSLNGGATWNQENTQFPNTVTEQLVVSGANLYAFTHGRGVFRVPLTTSNNATIRLDMVATSQSVHEADVPASVQFKVRTPNHLPTSGSATVNYTIAPGTATLSDDFTAGSGSFIIPNATADEATLSVPVASIVDDDFGEPVETFTVTFDPPAGVVLSRTSHTVSITNDSPTPDPVGVSILDRTVTEGNGPGTTTASVVVQLAYPADSLVTMNYATANGSALAGTDYTAATDTLAFNIGESSKTISVPIFGDGCPEVSKSFDVVLSNLSATGLFIDNDNQATVTINDNDLSGTFQLSAPRIIVAESAAKAMVTVTRTGGLGGGAANCVGFSLRTQNGSATAPSDFTAVGPGPFFFAAGATSKVVEVPIVNDTQDEPEESFVVELVSTVGPGAALGAQQTQVVAITDNDTAGMLQFSATALTASEGAGSATFTVKRTGGNTGPLTVDVLATGTATGGGGDFDAPAQLTFNANQTSAPLVVTLSPDGFSEGNEVVNFRLDNPTLGATIGAKSTATLTITDDEATVFYSAATFTANESAPSAIITVKRAGSLAGTATVNYATSAGTAEAGAGGDYNDVTGTLTFAPNVSSRTFTVPLLPDFVAEGADETVNLSLNNPSGAAIGTTQPTAVLNIVENDFGGAVSFGAASYAPKEPVNGSAPPPTKLNVVIKRTGGLAQGATVLLSTVNGSATSGADFVGVTNQSVVFPAGKASVTEVIEILHDPDPEGPESFTLALTDPLGGATLGSPASSIVTIADNEPVIEWSAATFTGKEPAIASAVVNLTLKRTGSTVGPATVDVRVIGGSATLGGDFVFAPNPRSVSLPTGKSSVTVPITLNQDGLFEGVETVLLQLENAVGAAVGPRANTTLNITDEEPTVQFSLSAFMTTEPGGSTPTNAVITVKRTGRLTSGTNVDYATSDLTATAGQDYTAIPTTTLNFPAKVASKSFTVPIRPDLDDEQEEAFRVTLSNPAAGSLGPLFQADVKIKDNDVAGKLQFQTAVSSVSEDGGPASLTVTRTSGTGLATVNYATQSGVGTGGANSGTDFDVTTGTLTFNPGENSKTITINITPDGLVEGGEYFTVVLSSPGNGATLGPLSTATVWIVDVD